VRLRRFAAAAALAVGLALIVTGCGGHSRHRRSDSDGLSIYTSLPFEGPYASEAQAIYEGEELALTQTGGVVDGYKVVLRRLDDSDSSSGASPTLVTKQAQIAAGDPSTVAYIGELTPGSSSGSIRILSHRGILQVSPGDTATGLAGKTFARVVPPDSDEAAAEVAAISRLGVKTVYLVGDRTTYGRDIAAAVRADAPTYDVVVVNAREKYLPGDTRALVKAIRKSKASAILYAGSPGASVVPFWNALSAAEGRIEKFASATIAVTPYWAQTTAAARDNTYLSASGAPPNRLPRAGSQFETDFLATYGSRAPWENGIFGYVAMSAVLEALHSLSGHPNDLRAKIVKAFMHIRDLPSALGTYSIADGQTSFHAYYFTAYSRYGAATTFFPGSA
jgi:branched-chain amino acid transport system substrate-binding protein